MARSDDLRDSRLRVQDESLPCRNVGPIIRLLAMLANCGVDGAVEAQTMRSLHAPQRLSMGGTPPEDPYTSAESGLG
jgi:hypothetical protein